jgi:hypothetical protein
MEEPTPEPQTCEECFTQFLTAQQRTAFEDAINMDIEAQCQILEDSLVFNPLEFEVELEAVAHNLGLVGVDNETAGQIIECLERLKTRIIGTIAGNIIAAIPAVHIPTNKDSAAGLW